MNIIEFVKNTVQRTFSKYDERFSAVAESGSYTDLSDKPTIPEAYDDTALAARVTAVEDGKASLQVAAIPGGGGGEEINALVSQGENSVSVSYYKDGELPNTLNFNVDSDYFTIPATGYVDQKAAETQSYTQTYTDLKLTQKQNTLVSGTNIKTFNGESLLGSGDIPIPTYVGSGWGVAKTGSVNANTTMTPTTVDISDLRLSGVDDYQVAVSISGSEASSNYKVIVVKTSKDSFTITTSAHVFTIYYTVFAKGYGGVPNGGTTGQVLAKKSGADGDTEWVTGGGGINIEVGAERWYGTYTDENGVTYQVYSKMIYIPALPAVAGIETYSHGISGIKQILQVYGFTTDGFVLNAPRQNAQDNIAIYQMSKSATNQTLSIEVGKDRSNKAAYVCLVYAKNN